MAVDITAMLDQITSMPVQDHLELLHQAWDRLLESGWQPEGSDEQKTELDRRLDDLVANPQNALPLEKFVEHIRRKR